MLEKDVLTESHIIAVVGMSDNPERPSFRVASHLQNHGYRIIPVNPTVKEVLGEKSYPDLVSVPFPIDVVDVFRRSEELPGIVDQAIKVRARTVWMQEGVVNKEAAARARDAGLTVVMDKCMRKEHIRLCGGRPF